MKLQVFDLAERDHLVQPEEFSDIQGDSSALSLVTDFRQHKPPMINGHMEAAEALTVMRAEDVGLKLVVDANHECIGVIAQEDLSEHNRLLKQLELHVGRSELSVQDLMHHRRELRAMEYTALERASVDDVISALENYHQQYLLVVDSNAHHIRGLISSRDISRRLHSPIHIHKERTFADIFTAVRVQ